MAFFDDLSKKLTQVGQTTIQKTKEMADIAKLSSQVNDEEKKIENAYIQMGKIYRELHADDCEERFAEWLQLIGESEAKIKDYKEEIKEIKGVGKCEACGAEVPNGSGFCPGCGAKVPVVEKAAEVQEVQAEAVSTDDVSSAE